MSGETRGWGSRMFYTFSLILQNRIRSHWLHLGLVNLLLAASTKASAVLELGAGTHGGTERAIASAAGQGL